MLRQMLGCAVAAIVALSSAAVAQESKAGLTKGTPDLKSAGPLAFAPDGVLLVGDPIGGAVFALGTGDTAGKPDEVKLDVPGLDQKIASALGTTPAEVAGKDKASKPPPGQADLPVLGGARRSARPRSLCVPRL